MAAVCGGPVAASRHVTQTKEASCGHNSTAASVTSQQTPSPTQRYVVTHGTGTWYRHMVQAYGTGTWHRHMVQAHGTGTWYTAHGRHILDIHDRYI